MNTKIHFAVLSFLFHIHAVEARQSCVQMAMELYQASAHRPLEERSEPLALSEIPSSLDDGAYSDFSVQDTDFFSTPMAFRQDLTDEERLFESRIVLGRDLNENQSQALIDAHNVGKGEVGENGHPASIGNYTQEQIDHKARILRRAGFNIYETRRLMEQGLVGSPSVSSNPFPPLDFDKHFLLLYSHKEEFPYLYRESLLNDFDEVVASQAELINKLEATSGFNESMRGRDVLLTISIQDTPKEGKSYEVIDEEFLRSWGDSLANSISNKKHLDTLGKSEEFSGELLDEIKMILESPHGMVNPDSLIHALAGTIEGITPELRMKIVNEMREGSFSTLMERLADNPEEFGFKASLLGLEEGGSKEYYLDILQKSFASSKRLDELVPTYLFSRNVPDRVTIGDFLRDMNEGDLDIIKDIHSKTAHVDEIIAVFPKANKRVVKRFLHTRLRRIGRDVSSHKKTITEEASESGVELTLREVHPHLGIFRGNIGDDCGTSNSFGFANSPNERVFFILNNKGEDVGYLNGTTVELPSGEKAFFVNTISGKRVSGTMTESIFSSLVIDEVKDALGVREIVLLGEQNTRNINFSIIQNVYGQSRGRAVRVYFPDEEVRRVIGEEVVSSEYDSAENLQNANYLNAPTSELSVKVEKRDFGISLERGISVQENLSEGEKFILFINNPETASRLGINFPEDFKVTRSSLDQLFPDGMNDDEVTILVEYFLRHKNWIDSETLRFLLGQISGNVDGDVIRNMVNIAIKERIDPETLKVLFSRIPESTDGRNIESMVNYAIRERIDPETLKVLLGRIPENIESRYLTYMVRVAIKEKVDPETLKVLLDRIPENIAGNEIRLMVETAIEEKINPESLKLLLGRIPENIDGDNFYFMVQVAIRERADSETFNLLLVRIPENIESKHFVYMVGLIKRVMIYPETVEIIFSRMPENIDDEHIRFIVEGAMRGRVGPETVKIIFSRISESIEGLEFSYIVQTAIREGVDFESLKVLLGRTPKNMESVHIGLILSTAIEKKVNPQILKFLLDRISKNMDDRYIDEVWNATPLLQRDRLSDEDIKRFRESLEELKRRRGIE